MSKQSDRMDRYTNIDSRLISEEVWPKYKLEEKDGLTRVITWFRVRCNDDIYVIREYVIWREKEFHNKYLKQQGTVLEYLLSMTATFFEEVTIEASKKKSSGYGPIDMFQG